MGALLRGCFEYVYSASSLVLIPHIPDALTAFAQKFVVRWGPYSLRISTTGVRSSGIKSATINGQPVNEHADAIGLLEACGGVVHLEFLPDGAPATEVARAGSR